MIINVVMHTQQRPAKVVCIIVLFYLIQDNSEIFMN